MSDANKNDNNTTAGGVNDVDLSMTVGGRKVEPALAVVDASHPTVLETLFNDQLLTPYSSSNIPLESSEGIKTRERALNRLGRMSRSWIESVCRKLLLPQEVTMAAGGQLFTSGSYRLGVHEPGADIDCILVAPEMCTREDFFGSGYTPPNMSMNAMSMPSDGTNSEDAMRDPESLAMRIKHHPDVTNFNAVEGAAVPILTFDWEGINIDLLFARLTSPSVPQDLNIDHDGVLDGVDSATEKSLNGPRVTNLIAAAASGTPVRYQTFLKVVRCVRKWAKARGLYSNKMGYWGGVNINIAVAFCLQLYPNASPFGLLRKFFLVFKTWRWPNPIMLTKPHDANLGLTVWSPQQAMGGGGGHGGRGPVAPMITPAYPAMNSTMSISRQTLQIFQEEFNRGHAILDKIWKDFKKKNHPKKKAQGGMEGEDEDASHTTYSGSHNPLQELFEPSDFFIQYPHYLSLCIVANCQEEVQAWAGFVESRLRKLVSDLLGRALPISKIQLWPKKIEACIADKTAGEALTDAQRRNCLTYLIGFHIDLKRMRGEHLNVEQQIQKFKDYDLVRYQPLLMGMDVLFRTFQTKRLPPICFDGSYPASTSSTTSTSTISSAKQYAMRKRKRLLEASPMHQEQKRLAKLEQLKRKMAQMQEKLAAASAKKKKSAAKTETEVKAKNEQEDDGATTTSVVKKEEGDGAEEEERMTAIVKQEPGVDVDVTVEPGAGAEPEDDPDMDADAEDNEESLLQNTLDTLQQGDDAGAQKTREEAELERQKLLAGDYDNEAMNEDPNKEEASGEQQQHNDGTNNNNIEQQDMDDEVGLYEEGFRPTMLMPQKTVAQKEAEVLAKAGFHIVTDEDATPLGSDLVWPRDAYAVMSPFQRLRQQEIQQNQKKKEQQQQQQQPNQGGDDDGNVDGDDVKAPLLLFTPVPNINISLKLVTKFPGIVELDAFGYIVDKGDEDYQPSHTWVGRKAGFEFKVGERGLGYYRTGTPVVVPSNVAYH
jgi:poly(A) polymerase